MGIKLNDPIPGNKVSNKRLQLQRIRKPMQCKNGHFYSTTYCKICEEKPEKKKPKGIRKVALKRKPRNEEYKELAIAYLKLHPVCEVENCFNNPEQIHHKQGRVGSLLTDVNHFLAVCDACHKYIELNPIWAKVQGYSESRI